MSEAGFIDLQADSVEQMKSIRRTGVQSTGGTGVSLDPVAAAESMAHTGAQITGDVNLALRILARVDPARVAALLK